MRKFWCTSIAFVFGLQVLGTALLQSPITSYAGEGADLVETTQVLTESEEITDTEDLLDTVIREDSDNIPVETDIEDRETEKDITEDAENDEDAVAEDEEEASENETPEEELIDEELAEELPEEEVLDDSMTLLADSEDEIDYSAISTEKDPANALKA